MTTNQQTTITLDWQAANEVISSLKAGSQMAVSEHGFKAGWHPAGRDDKGSAAMVWHNEVWQTRAQAQKSAAYHIYQAGLAVAGDEVVAQ